MSLLRKILPLFFVIFIFSCYSQKIVLNSDKKSGTVTINYTFDDNDFEVISLALSAGNVNSNAEEFDPSYLLDQKEFVSYFNRNKTDDISLKSISITKKKNQQGLNVYSGNIVVAFTNYENMLKKIPTNQSGFKYLKEGNIVTIEQVIDLSNNEDVETLDNFIEMLKNDKPAWYNKFIKSPVEIVFVSPTPIIATKNIALSKDKLIATYNFEIGSMVGKNRKKLDFMIKF